MPASDKVKDQMAGILSKIDPKNYYYIFGGLLVLLLLIDYFVLMRPQLSALSKVRTENKKLTDDIKQLKDDSGRLTSYETQIGELTTKVEQADYRLRPKGELDYIIQGISNMANENKVLIDQIMSEAENQKEVLKNNKRTYYALPIVIEGKSSFHNFGRFVNRMETDNVSLTVSSFSLTKTDDIQKHKMKLTVKAIVYEEK